MTGYRWDGCAADSDYNITNLNESDTGSHGKNNTVVIFMDAATRDFRLSALDAAVVDAGMNLFNSPSINEGKDIAEQMRDSVWAIGAFELFKYGFRA